VTEHRPSAGSNLLLVPLDRRGQWYRYHHLFRDMLLAELHRLEPGLMPAGPAGARTIMREVDHLLRRRPGLRTLAGEAQALQAQLASGRVSTVPGASALTAAELRLLPLLSTHLSFPEIAEEMFLSCNTIKSTVHSIYRKLGASSRSQAVSRSVELGLLAG
jgi:ATP/maltotriose-dependent transcriptional regulator MalT